jgi:hypothetical protein
MESVYIDIESFYQFRVGAQASHGRGGGGGPAQYW